MWSPLTDDGARYTCAIITFFYGEEWRCPRDAAMALDADQLERLQTAFKKFTNNRIRAMHRSFCPRHQVVVEDYLAAGADAQ